MALSNGWDRRFGGSHPPHRAQRRGHLRRLGLARAALLASVLVGPPASAQDSLPAPQAIVAGAAPDRMAAAVALCEAGDWEGLRPALLDPAAAVRHLAVSCWVPPYGDLPLLAGLVDDPEAAVRVALAERLAATPEAPARRALERLLDDPEPAVRLTALRGLDELGDAEVREVLTPLLHDRSLEVAAAAAGALARRGLEPGPDGADRAAYDSAVALAGLLDTAPELAGAISALQERISRLVAALQGADEGPMRCATGSRAALESVAASLRELAAAPSEPKQGDRFEALLGLESDLGTAQEAYNVCLGATPLMFDETAAGTLGGGVGERLLGEVAAAWEASFGLLRSDLTGPVEGGELWVQTTLGADLVVPDLGSGQEEAPAVPSLEVSGRLDRHQLFKYEELSSWGGGLFARGWLPFDCGGYRRCLLTASVLGRRSPGTDADFPTRLVAGQRRFASDLAFELPLGDVRSTLTVDAERVRYERDALEPAGLDTAGARLDLDSTFQLQLEARRNAFAQVGPTGEPAPGSALLDRDSTFLSGQLGVRFGEARPGEGLQLYVLGGMAFPLVDGVERDTDPQVTFTALLRAQDGPSSGDMSRFELGGRRYAEASARDFAVQTVSESFLAYTYQGLDLPDSGMRFEARVAHELVQYHGPLTEELDALDINVITGHLGVRFVLGEWVGVELADTIRAIRFRDKDFQAANRFLVSLFVPLGDYGMGREEGLPW